MTTKSSRRGQPRQRTPFTNTARWEKVRRRILERDGWLCQIRGRRCTVEATCVDHIVPWRVGGAWYDPRNLRAACSNCNEDRVWRKRAKPKPSREW